jgi:Protein of unknown function (DUF3443)
MLGLSATPATPTTRETPAAERVETSETELQPPLPEGSPPGPSETPGATDEIDPATTISRIDRRRSASRRRKSQRRRLVNHRGLVATGIAVVVVAAVAVSMFVVGSSPASHKTATTATTSPVTKPPVAKPKSATTASTPTLTVPLHSSDDDPRPLVTIGVGNDKPINVVLDTGSVGLRVFSNLVPVGRNRGIRVTTRQDSIEYGDGTEANGSVSFAQIHIGRIATSVIPFELAQDVGCDPDAIACPASSGELGLEADGVDGIMGIGMGGSYQGDPTTNPLLSLPAPYNRSWSIAMFGGGATLPARGALVLGAHTPKNPAAQFPLEQSEQTNAGSPTWNDWFNLCWTVGGVNNCELSVFDSGTDLTILSGSAFADAPTEEPGYEAYLNSGTSIQAAEELDGNPLWSFTSGDGPMSSVVVIPGGDGMIITGVQPYYSFTVTYDEAHGNIYLS